MRYIQYYIIISLLFYINTNFVAAQSFEERYKQIELELTELANDSIIPGLNEYANFSVANASVQDLLRGVASTHNLNISIDPSINAQISNNFSEVLVKDLILFVVREYRLNIRFLNNIISFYPFTDPRKPYVAKPVEISYDPENELLSLNLKNDSLRLFAQAITDLTNKNVIMAPGTSSEVLNGYIKSMPFEQALDKVAFTNNLLLDKTDDNFFVFKPKPLPESNLNAAEFNNRGVNRNMNNPNNPNVNAFSELVVRLNYLNGDTLIDIDAINVPVTEVIKEVSAQANKNYIYISEPTGNTSCLIQKINYKQFLNFILQASEFTFREQESVYLIGGRREEGLRSTKLVRLQYRTIDSLEVFIPEELKKGIEIKEFKELNGFILTGGEIQINEIAEFLNQIDQPVPNISIDVMVVDVRKGVNLQTGIKAFLGDSVPPTSGQVFPGVDVTLSSSSINNFLDKLTDNGLVNLGRVTPRFYATIQALEQNNLLDLQSTPKLSTLNGHEANLTIGQSRFYLEQTQNITGGVTPINSLSQRWLEVEANLSITIYPIISGDEHITMNIEAEFSDFIEPELEGAPPGNATRKFISKIRVRNEEMIVLGGLEEVRKSNSRSGLPLLSRVPVLNWIFSSKSVENTNGRLLVFIKPTIIY